jgi:hypothetical protein
MIFALNCSGSMEENSRASLRDAARRWGVEYYEYRCGAPTDALQVFDLPSIDATRIMVVAADVLVRGDAPNPFDYEGVLVAARILGDSRNSTEMAPADEQARVIHHDMSIIASKFGRIDYSPDAFISVDLFVTDRALAHVLREAYAVAAACPRLLDHCQSALNYVLTKHGVAVSDIGCEWNARASQWPQGRMEHFVYHYDGSPEQRRRIQQQEWHAGLWVRGAAGNGGWHRRVRTREDLPDILRARSYRVGMEIGVARGAFSEHILRRWDGKLYSLDCWEHQEKEYITASFNDSNGLQQAYYEETRRRLAEFGGRSVIVKGFSTKVTIEEMLDFVYVDANHSYGAVLADLEYWYPKVRNGGMVAGHDFEQGTINGADFGVIKALETFLADKRHVLHTTDERQYPSWILFKE